MEYRWSKRSPSRERVTLECPRIGVISANLDNISLGGMFVTTRERALAMNMRVFVSFSLPGTKHLGDFGLEAIVVRYTPVGVALAFLDMTEEVTRMFQTALSEDPGIERSPLSAAG